MFAHETELRVLYAHTDKAGVVYYANYLQFFELGRAEHMRALGKTYADFEKEGVLLTVTEAHIRYIRPAFYDDLLTIRAWISRVRRTRIDHGYEILNPAGKTICQGSTVLGCISAATGRPSPLPETLLALVGGLGRKPPRHPDSNNSP